MPPRPAGRRRHPARLGDRRFYTPKSWPGLRPGRPGTLVYTWVLEGLSGAPGPPRAQVKQPKSLYFWQGFQGPIERPSMFLSIAAQASAAVRAPMPPRPAGRRRHPALLGDRHFYTPNCWPRLRPGRLGTLVYTWVLEGLPGAPGPPPGPGQKPKSLYFWQGRQGPIELPSMFL